MPHLHTHSPCHTQDGAYKNIRAAFVLNLIFTVIEIVGGIFTNSIAILSDAVHDLGDSIVLGASLYFEKLSLKNRTAKLTYGYKRYSVLGALVSSLVLLIGSMYILFQAIPRVVHPQPVNSAGMLLLSVLGIAVNLLAVLRLKGGQKLNEKVVYLHLLEDVLGWIAVFIVSVILLFIDLPVLDPILSILITIFVLSRIFPSLIKSLRIFLQYAPHEIETKRVKEEVLGIPAILDIHDIHLWSLDGVHHILSAHLVVKKDIVLSELKTIKNLARERVKNLGIEHATFEFELDEEDCVECP